MVGGKAVLPAAKKGASERPAADFPKEFGTSEGNPDESYVCRDKKSGGLVAVFPLNIHDNSAIDQCEALMKLQHEHVIPHTGYFRDETNHLFMTAELPLLADLHTRVRSKKYIKKYFGQIDALKILSRISEGLAFCHEKKIAHRDIKLENIYYTPDNIIKIGNFLLDIKPVRSLYFRPDGKEMKVFALILVSPVLNRDDKKEIPTFKPD
jgi:serine/threonine protein kinase